MTDFKKTACVLCSVNCGIEVQTGGRDGRELLKIKGDKDNPLSKGYVCNKASRLNHYQMGADRIDSPMRRKPDGSYEAVDWDTAIKEVAAGLAKVRDQQGGDKILYVGGGGQGNHLGGVYADGLKSILGVKYQTNALAQEKTGEFWVQGKMFGSGPHGDFEHAEVSIFLGKNPWHSHGFHEARKILKEIAKDPGRSMVVIDPCKTKTAEMADYHVALKPATDAWYLSALIAVLIQDDLVDSEFIHNHTSGFEELKAHFDAISVSDYADICEISEADIRAVAARIARAQSVSVFEDLGIQQTINSTLVSYLHRILISITGNFAKKGAAYIAPSLMKVTDSGSSKNKPKTEHNTKDYKSSPVLGSRVLIGLIPCNNIPDEVLTDHPDRFRAAIIESGNPVHSYSNSGRMREAMRALEFSVVIDVAMTETAREASYVLPASSSYEKYECVFFHVEFPANGFQLRQPVVEPLAGTLIEAEIHTRLIEALGGLDKWRVSLLKAAANINRALFAALFVSMTRKNPKLMKLAPSLLYRTLGTTLKSGKAAAAAFFWGISHNFIRGNKTLAANAGFTGSDWQAGEALFDALLNSPSGFIFADAKDDYRDSWNRMGIADKRINLYLEELMPELSQLDAKVLQVPSDYPLILAAGQRRGDTANTIIRDGSWNKKDNSGTLYMHPSDAVELNIEDGDWVRISTKTSSGETRVEINDYQRPGSIGLPNGTGLLYVNEEGDEIQSGIAPNELTSSDDRDFFAGTPWHKFVPAKVEKISA